MPEAPSLLNAMIVLDAVVTAVRLTTYDPKDFQFAGTPGSDDSFSLYYKHLYTTSVLHDVTIEDDQLCYAFDTVGPVLRLNLADPLYVSKLSENISGRVRIISQRNYTWMKIDNALR